MALFWVVWGERNRRIFENIEGDEIDQIWDRIRFWSSLWLSTTSEFRDLSLSFILSDWKAAIVKLAVSVVLGYYVACCFL